jgi:hypothetical protein
MLTFALLPVCAGAHSREPEAQPSATPAASAAPAESSAPAESPAPESSAPAESPAPESSAPAESPAPGAPSSGAPAQRNEFDNTWHTTVSPYVWLPGIKGTLVFRRPVLAGAVGGAINQAQINVSTGPSNYLSFINSGGLVAANVRKGLFNVGADLIFLNLSHSGSSGVTITGPGGKVEVPVSAAVGWHINSTIWELVPGFTVAHGDAGSLDVFAGVRSLSMTSAANWTFTGPIMLVPLTGQGSLSFNLTDFIGGIRGSIRLGGRWFIPYYGDAGSGGGNSTSQYYAGIGYAQHWGNLLLFYRDLNYSETGDTARIRNLELAGLALGATFNL